MIYATHSYAELAARVAALARLPIGEVETRLFPDGERYLRLVSDPASRDIVVLGGTVSEPETLELYDLACGVVEAGARSLTLVIPYFGYSTMERATRPNEVVTAKNRARLLSSIPAPPWGSRVLLLDLHTEGIPFYFEGSLRPVQLSAAKVVLQCLERLGSEVVACTDAGRAKWVERFANDLDIGAAFVFKRRRESGLEVTAVSAQVAGKRVVIYDDLIRSGASLLAAARAYREAGAASMAAVATHGVFPEDSVERLRGSGLLDRVVITDSHPRGAALRSDFLEVVSIAPVLAAALSG
jgi:ribose-phosphate pyrophosphokinase